MGLQLVLIRMDPVYQAGYTAGSEACEKTSGEPLVPGDKFKEVFKEKWSLFVAGWSQALKLHGR